MAKTAIQIREVDQVATATEDLFPNDTVQITGVLDKVELLVIEHIPTGHKIAIKEILKDKDIYKYGEVIGMATQLISPGAHVHVHNCWGLKARRLKF
jgi:altronate dehydratase small subunit